MEDIKPRGIVERLYVADIAALSWEILRLRRCETAVVNIAFKHAVSHTVYRLAGEPRVGSPEREWYEGIVVSKPKARKEVLKLLAEFRLDESAIEAEAIRSVFSELEVLDRMLSLLESRRTRTHHRDIHSLDDEIAWWERRAIDPVGTARMLWISTRRLE
jgi:hypothetical protein